MSVPINIIVKLYIRIYIPKSITNVLLIYIKNWIKMLKEAIKPLLYAAIQKRLCNNKIVLSTRNDRSIFFYQKLLLKVCSKDMTVY